MKLIDDFYKVITCEKSAPGISAEIELDPHHAIFRGHFPQIPVVPGVCFVQMVKEIVAAASGLTLHPVQLGVLKFIQPVNPKIQTRLELGITIQLSENNHLRIDAGITAGTSLCFRLTKGIYRYQGDTAAGDIFLAGALNDLNLQNR